MARHLQIADTLEEKRKYNEALGEANHHNRRQALKARRHRCHSIGADLTL
jgi:hypothetical protein